MNWETIIIALIGSFCVYILWIKKDTILQPLLPNKYHIINIILDSGEWVKIFKFLKNDEDREQHVYKEIPYQTYGNRYSERGSRKFVFNKGNKDPIDLSRNVTERNLELELKRKEIQYQEMLVDKDAYKKLIIQLIVAAAVGLIVGFLVATMNDQARIIDLTNKLAAVTPK